MNVVESEIERHRAEILALSREIHARPEPAFEEHEASRLLRSVLERNGFAVVTGIGGLPTAFRAKAIKDSNRPRIVYTAEMDALPGLGHACGHNIIGTAAVWSAALLKGLLGDGLQGTIEVVGTPAEERGSGKAALIEAGVFDDADAVLQIHPHALDTVISQAMARRSLTVEFFGKTSHAAAAPQEGRNALNALILFYHALILSPGRFPPGCLFHGVIEKGGEVPNVIPDFARGRFSFRADAMSKIEPGMRERGSPRDRMHAFHHGNGRRGDDLQKESGA